MRNGLGKWFARRFVFLSEVAGYGISAAVAAFVIYAAFAQTDVSITVEGALRPSSTALTAKAEALVLERLVADGAEVAPDTGRMRPTRRPTGHAQGAGPAPSAPGRRAPGRGLRRTGGFLARTR